MIERYLEDFTVGQTFGSGEIVVEKEDIKAFAAKFDPQPFHLWMKRRRMKRSSADWRRTAGIPRP